MDELIKIKNAVSRSVSAENFTGEKGKGGMAAEGLGLPAASELGIGWKVSPAVLLKGNTDFVLADIRGEGSIRHIWMTCAPDKWRSLILKIYWEGCAEPSVYVPAGDFFCCGWCERVNISSQPVAVNPAGGFNSYWRMPFKKRARIVMENMGEEDVVLYYSIDYVLEDMGEDIAYFHSQWRRTQRLQYKDVYVITDNIKGKGHYVGTYLAWQVNSNGWWGEGEIKFYIDGDKEFPTICGTGTEDYFGGAWNFEFPQGQYGTYSTPYLGLPQVIKPDGLYRANTRFGMYRWHINDPVYFAEDLKVTIQALGWRRGGKYLPLQDDIASVAYWYQDSPVNAAIIYPKEIYEVN